MLTQKDTLQHTDEDSTVSRTARVTPQNVFYIVNLNLIAYVGGYSNM